MLNEQWKPAPGYPRYEVSSLGRVRSCDMEVGATAGATAKRKGRILAQARKANGYLQVTLTHEDGSRESVSVHKLVARAFHGMDPFPGAQVCHADGSRDKNWTHNLRWGTAKENAEDRERHRQQRLNS